MYQSFNNLWNGAFTTSAETVSPAAEHIIDQQQQPRITSMIGPMTIEEWQEIMAEANKKIRSLQFTAMEQNNI